MLGPHPPRALLGPPNAQMLDVSLIVFAIVVPLVLVLANLVILAKFIDPQAAAGHWVAKIMLVRARGLGWGRWRRRGGGGRRGSCGELVGALG